MKIWKAHCLLFEVSIRDQSILLLFSPILFSGNSFFWPIMLKILLKISIFCSKLSYIASYLTVMLCDTTDITIVSIQDLVLQRKAWVSPVPIAGIFNLAHVTKYTHIKMVSNQVDIWRDILKCINHVPLLGQWVEFGSTWDLKQKKKRFWSHHRLVFY